MISSLVILTSGLSGSSVATGLIARAGYWVGDKTVRKDGFYDKYETYENDELVDLNKRLFDEVGFDGKHKSEFDPAWPTLFDNAYESIDKTPYREFLDKCNKHQPWIWKDPRLWLTMRFWRHLWNPEEVQFVLLTRESLQAWTSMILKRQIVSYDHICRYQADTRATMEQVAHEMGKPVHQVSFEGLVTRPEKTIAALNVYLGTSLTLEDLRAIYTKPLYRRPRGSIDLAKAALIYLKNFSERSV